VRHMSVFSDTSKSCGNCDHASLPYGDGTILCGLSACVQHPKSVCQNWKQAEWPYNFIPAEGEKQQ